MINGENNYMEYNTDYEYVADLNELFQKTFEFDILKYVTRGLIKNQQKYENELIEIKLDNLKSQKEIALLHEEINILKNIDGKKVSEKKDAINYQQKKDNIEANIQKLLNSKEKINIKNKNLTNTINNQYYEENFDRENQFISNEKFNNKIKNEYDNIYIDNKTDKKEDFKENGSNANIPCKNIQNKETITNTDKEKDLNDVKKISNENNQNDIRSTMNIDNSQSQNLLNKNLKENLNNNREINSPNKRSYMLNQMNYKSRINSAQIDSELKFLKSKLSDIEKNLLQFKKITNDTLVETNKSIPDIISNKILLLKEDNQSNINMLNEKVEEKLASLNDIINKLTLMNEENEKLINITKAQNNTLIGKMDIINAKFVDIVAKTDFDKYKNAMYEKIENDNKGVNIDISLIKKSINGIKDQILEITSDQTDHQNLENLIIKFENANMIINKLQDFQKDFLEKEKRRLNIDPTRLVDIDQFTDLQKNQTRINEKYKKEIHDINRDINDIKNFELVTKATFKDLKNLEDKTFSKLEELLTYIKERFVEKKSLQKYTKLIEYQTKQSLEEFKSNLKPGINWLMTKKPMGHLCASCEAYLGDLNTSNIDKFIPWNKYSSRESTDSKNKITGGFSKILQLVNNYDKEKEKDLIQNLVHQKSKIPNVDSYTNKNFRRNSEEQNNNNYKKTASNSANYSNILGNISKSNINNSNNISKNNIENNNSFQIEEYENDLIGSLPKIKKKIFSATNIQNFDENLFQKHSFTIAKGKKEKENNGFNNDFIIMTKQDQDKSKNERELNSPKITKILKKINKNKDSLNILNNDTKQNNENK